MNALSAEFSKYWHFKPVQTMVWVRLASYLTIFISPFWGMLLAIYFDAWDWDYLQKYHMDKSWYHRIDKVVDYIEYIVLIPLVLWTPIATVYLLFLAWRTIGTIWYFIGKKNDSIFVFFPNIAEHIALLYFMSSTFHLGWNVTTWPWLVSLFVIKLAIELQLHYYKVALPIADKTQPKWIMAFAKFNRNLIK